MARPQGGHKNEKGGVVLRKMACSNLGVMYFCSQGSFHIRLLIPMVQICGRLMTGWTKLTEQPSKKKSIVTPTAWYSFLLDFRVVPSHPWWSTRCLTRIFYAVWCEHDEKWEAFRKGCRATTRFLFFAFALVLAFGREHFAYFSTNRIQFSIDITDDANLKWFSLHLGAMDGDRKENNLSFYFLSLTRTLIVVHAKDN